MTYSVKEIFYTLQGEGGQAGTPAVFCRFAGCNLWTGREQDRAQAICQFCDTDFVGTDGTLGGKFETATALAELIAAQWPAGTGHRLVDVAAVLSGQPGACRTLAHAGHADRAVLAAAGIAVIGG